jgi:hypothetical protein
MTVSNEDIFAAFDLSGDILSDVLTDEVGFINKNRTAVRRDVPSQALLLAMSSPPRLPSVKAN